MTKTTSSKTKSHSEQHEAHRFDGADNMEQFLYEQALELDQSKDPMSRAFARAQREFGIAAFTFQARMAIEKKLTNSDLVEVMIRVLGNVLVSLNATSLARGNERGPEADEVYGFALMIMLLISNSPYDEGKIVEAMSAIANCKAGGDAERLVTALRSGGARG